MNLIYLKKMTRLVVAGLLLQITTLNAGTTYASGLRTYQMSVYLENATLKELFDLIEEKFDYSFLIRHNDIDLDERITMKVADKSVEEILTVVLKKQKAEFTVNDDRIIVYKSHLKKAVSSASKEKQVAQQTGKISGTVVDETTGEPVIGANVIVKGTAVGTVTDYDGNFSFDAPSGSMLVISYIGYINMEMEASASPMTIRIKEDTHALEEVVVVGYGVQKRESLTGAMQVVSGEQLNDISSASVSNMLQAKAPGVHVQSSGGKAGEDANIVIRGKSTINGSTDPLWVIDGVITGNSSGQLNPNDIESISVLKDAASTAIYGSSGANGVVLVTTKKAKPGEARIDVSANWTASNMHLGNMKMMNGAELYEYYQSYANQEAINFAQYTPGLANRNYDWWKEGSQTGWTQDYNISVSGGTEKMKSFVSVGLFNQEGTVKGDEFSRYTFRYNMDYQAKPWLTIRPKVSGARSDRDDKMGGSVNGLSGNINGTGAALSAMYINLPWDSPYDENGNLIQANKPTNWIAEDKSNYLYDRQWNYIRETRYEATVNMDFDIRFTDWLTFASVNAYNLKTMKRKIYKDPQSSEGVSTDGSIEDRNFTRDRIYTNQVLRFNKDFGKHALNGVLGYEWINEQYENFAQTGTGFVSGFEIASVTTSPQSIQGTKTAIAKQSYFMNVNYACDHRYLLGFSFRRDGSSNFGADSKYGNFFSVSGGWNIHQEEFFQADWAQQLKLRASYGSVGRSPDEYYPQYGLYRVTSSNKYNGNPGALIDQLANPDLTWEKTYTAGIGVDAVLFDRLTFNLDFYHKRTTDLLYKVPQPGVIGVSEYWQNVGEVKNRGLEILVGYDVIKQKDFYWNVSANIAHNKNEITELFDGNKPILVSNGGGGIQGVLDKRMMVGRDIDTWYGAEWAGVSPETGAPLWYYTAANGNRETTSDYSLAKTTESMAVLGKMSPDFYGGFSTNFSWKSLSLMANFGYSVGGKIFSYSRTVQDSDGAYPTYNQMKLQSGWKRWEKPGDHATHPVPVYGNKSNSQSPSSRQLENAGFLRLRNLTVGYTLPWKLPQIHSAKLTLSGENLFLVSGFSGSDPELPGYDQSGKAGVFVNSYIAPRRFSFGLNITL
jgi:TonB-linked SusC/RagA family outer membrane protein